VSAPGDLAHDFFDLLMESQYWPRETLVSYQREQLEQLLRHAKRNVPFYADRLDTAFEPDGPVAWSRWHELPIVTRRDLFDHHDAMQARALPPGHGPSGLVQTSGSSGLPISFTVNRLTNIANEAARWRAHVNSELSWRKDICLRVGDNPAEAAWPEGRAARTWGPPWVEDRGTAWVVNRFTRPEQMLEFIDRREIAYLNGNPKYAQVMALESRRLGLPVAFEAILSQGERVGDDDRSICRDVFGARFVEHYSSKEGGQLAHPCPHGSLHVNEENALLEIVDDAGHPCPKGTMGRVVVTPFVSTAQPLIRYEQGDIAIEGTCTCGRASMVLASVVGRTLAIFRHPDGRTLARLLPEGCRETLQCTFWQVAQVGPNDYEVRYVPRAPDSTSDDAGFIREFRNVFFEDADITLVRTSSIPATAAGKHLEYVNEWWLQQMTN
jgi:phenylacetate-CoA ligase